MNLLEWELKLQGLIAEGLLYAFQVELQKDIPSKFTHEMYILVQGKMCDNLCKDS